MNIVSFVEPHLEPSELVGQGDGLFDDGANYAQPAAVLRVAFGEEWFDVSVTKRLTVRLAVVGAVGVSLLGREPRSPDLPSDRRDCVDQRNQLRDVVLVGAGDRRRQWRAVRVDHEVVFRARLGPVHGVRSRFFPPCIARTEDESMITLSKSRASWRRRWSSSTACNSSQTPALVHSSRRFHRVMPQHPISQGNSSQGMPVLSTNRMPLRQTRSSTRGRPPFGLGSCFGKSGSTNPQNSSVTSALDIASSVNKTESRLSILVPRRRFI